MRYGRAMRSFIGFLAVLAMLVGPLLSHFALTRPLTGFAVFAVGGIVATLVGLWSLVQLVRGRGLTTGGALGVLAGFAFFAIASQGRGQPRINDFTTDTADPPVFVFATNLGPNVGRDMGYPAAFAAVQQVCCSDLRPAKVAGPPNVAYQRALRVASDMPAWRVTRADAANFAIEAVATTKVFRFEDDVVIRIRPEPDGTSRVDVRSKSRDGKGDIGANTLRIHQYVDRLEAAK